MGSKGRPFREFDIEGWSVLVGRGAEDNEYLTFEVAEGRDMWMHVGGGTPGSHVVVRNPDGRDVPRNILEKAAALAAWYSKARGAPKANVDMCRASDVSKRRGAPRGQVEIKRYKRMKVQPALPEGASE